MSIIPARFPLTLYEGSTFDETMTFYADDAQTELMDFTGWTAVLSVKKDFDDVEPLLQIDSTVAPTPSASGIALGAAAGTVRLYVTDEDMAGIDAADFEYDAEEDRYVGVWDLELENPGGERFRYAMGQARFSREVD